MPCPRVFPALSPSVLAAAGCLLVIAGCSDPDGGAPAYESVCRDYVRICQCQEEQLRRTLSEDEFAGLRVQLQAARKTASAGDPAAPEAIELEGPLKLRRAYFAAVLACTGARDPGEAGKRP